MEIAELIELIYTKQKQQDEIKAEVSKLTEENKALDNEIKTLKGELFNLLSGEEPYKTKDLVAVKCHRTGTGYGDEKGLIKWLKENLEGKYLRVKTTEELDKNAFKKGLKEEDSLYSKVEQYITPTTTEYVVVTDSTNYEKMLQHVKEEK